MHTQQPRVAPREGGWVTKHPDTLNTGTCNAQTSGGGRAKRTGAGVGTERKACLNIGTRNAQSDQHYTTYWHSNSVH